MKLFAKKAGVNSGKTDAKVQKTGQPVNYGDKSKSLTASY